MSAYVATLSQSTNLRTLILEMQTKAASKQKEVASGRSADVGLALASGIAEPVSLRGQIENLSTLQSTNSTASTRLEASQVGLQRLVGDAQVMVDQLIALRDSDVPRDLLTKQAGDRLSALVDTLNTEHGGVYLFAGQNNSTAPVASYADEPISAARSATQVAWQSHLTTLGKSLSEVTGADIEAFLSGPFDALFSSSEWASNWSGAADAPTLQRISRTEVIEASATANEEPVQALAKAYVMIFDLGLPELGEEAAKALMDSATKTLGQAIEGVGEIQSRLGVAQERIASASTSIGLQFGLLNNRISELEGVDPFKTSSELLTLMTQLEVSYELTARLQRMSLLNSL